MDENSLTLAILREIRDNTARTNERVDHLTERVDHLTERVDGQGELLQTMAAVQVRQEALLQKLVDASLRHEETLQRHEVALHGIHRELGRIHDRIDNVFEGPLAGTVRDHETRLRRLEGRDS
jgi:phage shock protein A